MTRAEAAPVFLPNLRGRGEIVAALAGQAALLCAAGVGFFLAGSGAGLWPWGLVAALASAGAVALAGVAAWRLSRAYERRLAAVNQTLERAHGGLQAEVSRRLRDSLASRNAMIFGLAKLADYRDTDTGTHLDRICVYSGLLAEELRGQYAEITDDWIRCLRLAASLHDIGKVGIPDHVLLKPGALTPEERQIMERHTLIGADTLMAIRERLGDDELVNMGVQIALGHHERWDGTGYPFGLEQDQTGLAARIVALADVYDALTCKRVYKAAMGHEQARRIIEEGRATQFDPAIVDAFVRIHEQFELVRARFHGETAAEPAPQAKAA